MRAYRPSNGTEGMGFIDKFCENCKHEKFMHTNNHDDRKCDILNRSLIHDLENEQYPEEWIYDENGQPTCTKFYKFDWSVIDFDSYEDNYPDEEVDPNQLNLFGDDN